MAGSEAEERVRAAVEREMRVRWPAARIVHELQLEQGGVRIDIAAVDTDRLVIGEIKSEKDTLKRLARQMDRAVMVADEIWVCVAQKHETEARSYWDYQRWEEGETYDLYRRRTAQFDRLKRARLFIEDADTGKLRSTNETGWRHHYADPSARFELLWADEMRDALSRHFGGAIFGRKMTRPEMTRHAFENMNGREMRRAVCAQLRQRQFPRADPKIEAPYDV